MISCQKDEFFLPNDVHYLNCAFMAPMSRRVERAGIEGIRLKRNPALVSPDDFFVTSDNVRTAFAGIIGASDDRRISLAPSVSYGVATAARNLDCAHGSKIVVLFEQFPSHVYSWRRLADECDLVLEVISPPPDGSDRGRIWNERILEAISADTAAVCLPTVHWTDGTRYKLQTISERARDVNAALIIDATQSIGALPFNVEEVNPDCLVCAGYKWLMGPYSVTMVYWGDRFEGGVPLEENWIARRGSENFATLVDYEHAYQDGAIRYDVGERSNFVLMPMMLEALNLVAEFDPARIQEYCRILTAEALDEAIDMGFRIEENEYRSHHLFGIRAPDGIPLDRLKTALAERNVSASVRGSAIRVAPNVYNDEADVAALLDALRACMSESVR